MVVIELDAGLADVGFGHTFFQHRQGKRLVERAVEDAGDPQLALGERGDVRHPVQRDGESGGGDAENRQRENHLQEKESAFDGMDGAIHRASSWLSRMVAVSGW